MTLFSRNSAKARALAERFDVPWKTLEDARFNDYDVVINATVLGTAGKLANQSPAIAQQLRGARLAYDLVYNPFETRFLRAALDAGCETLGGFSMLVQQAAAQFSLWTGAVAPVGVMYEAAERELIP